MPRLGLLEVLAGPNQGRCFSLPLHFTASVGSAEDATIFLPHDSHLSAQHCSIQSDGKQFYLQDLQSQQGTFVYGINIAQVGSVPLPAGECFTAGETTFQVRFQPPDVLQTLRHQPEPLLAIIDTSRDERLWPLLNTSGAFYRSLFEGKRAQWLAQWAPYLVELPKSSTWLEQLVREGWGQHWGVYLTSFAPFETLLAHIRQGLWVQTEAGEKWYFRFYDPRTLRVFLPTLTVMEQPRFFGPVKRWLVEDGDEGEVLEYVPDRGAFWGRSGIDSEVSGPFILRQAQMKQFEEAVYTEFKIYAYRLLRKHVSRKGGGEVDPQWLQSFIEAGIHHAKRYNFETDRQIILFLLVKIKWGSNFDQRYDWAIQVLNDPNLPPAIKIDRLVTVAKKGAGV